MKVCRWWSNDNIHKYDNDDIDDNDFLLNGKWNSQIPLCKWNMSMIPAYDWKIKCTLEIAYCLSYNIAEAQRKQS